jgi:hypothetical protein
VCEHLFVTAQGSAYGRFRRARDSRNPPIPPIPPILLAAATELNLVSLPDALELVLLLVDEPGKFRRAALARPYCGEVPDVGFEEAQAVLACVAGTAGSEAAGAVARPLRRRGRREKDG